jgi:hypothetical protein
MQKICIDRYLWYWILFHFIHAAAEAQCGSQEEEGEYFGDIMQGVIYKILQLKQGQLVRSI